MPAAIASVPVFRSHGSDNVVLPVELVICSSTLAAPTASQVVG